MTWGGSGCDNISRRCRTDKYQAQTAVYLCDVFAQRNINRTIAQQMARWPKAIEEAKAKGAKEAGISISAAWGSNWTGEVSQADRMKMLERQYQLWEEAGIPVTKIGISDPMGWNMPDQVERQLDSDQETLAVDQEF